eukprot:TRINITY_DN3353_c0_g1_i1.p1 TRINITY_DN3353_c0_g1~~TRINITY_DN3353_c0_g1_i1.p1  ORF type:complete len:368 (-),score=71.91 TRINITY_DN3353_c0_g1_i1:90-1193(-)
MEANETLPELRFSSPVASIDFHPSNKLIATSLSSGQVYLHEFDTESTKEVMKVQAHSDSCRDLKFSTDGNFIFTCCADGSLSAIDINKQAPVYRQPNAHENPLFSLLVYDNLLATGDAEGVIKLWDLRTQKVAFEFNENIDYISDMVIVPKKNRILASSADGSLTVINTKSGTLEESSEPQEDEFLSVSILKENQTVVCGTQGGLLYVFDWGEWSEPSDRFAGHPLSIDAMVKIDEDTICTASSDGFLRLVQIKPNKFISVIGEHEDNGFPFPIEKLKISYPHNVVATSSHDSCVKLWDVAYLFQKEEEEGEVEEVVEVNDEGEGSDLSDHEMKFIEQAKAQVQAQKSSKKQKPNKKRKKRGFFSGL